MSEPYDYSQYDEGSTSPDALADLTRLAAKMANEMAEVERLTNDLKKAKATLRGTQEEDLPDKMEALGMQEFKTESGLKIKIRKDVFGSLPKDPTARQEALGWLISKDYGNLIKDSFALKFDKGDHERAAALAALLAEQNYGYERKEDVHPSTLKAFIRELLRDGDECPMELLGVRERKFAEIKNK